MGRSRGVAEGTGVPPSPSDLPPAEPTGEPATRREANAVHGGRLPGPRACHRGKLKTLGVLHKRDHWSNPGGFLLLCRFKDLCPSYNRKKMLENESFSLK